MREVVIYVAYDGEEFNNYEACLRYENDAFMLIRSIESKFTFYDKKMRPICAPTLSPEVEDWIAWLDKACSYCIYIKKTGSLTDDEAKIIQKNIGLYIDNEDFSCAVGLFEYNRRTGGWDKVDE